MKPRGRQNSAGIAPPPLPLYDTHAAQYRFMRLLTSLKVLLFIRLPHVC